MIVSNINDCPLLCNIIGGEKFIKIINYRGRVKLPVNYRG